MEEWNALRDQPRYSSQVGSGSSGSNRSHESDACGSNSVGSSARPMGREAAKKKGKKKSKETSELVEKEWSEFKQLREKKLEQMEKMTLMQQEANQVDKMKLYLQLSSDDHPDDRKKKMLEKLAQELFDD
ncbi:unnamed protein product [Trifolium pratense]|uniref:Uncharacterized protein n=1 Tax=Trifolium pratense TaxID=57577 RepID=A0ACB0KZB9_TRIPR|nr:unnamed protein product [Trifolium pratense]